jgi:hypothetical protein
MSETVEQAVALWKSAGMFHYESGLNISVPELAIIDQMRSDAQRFGVELCRLLSDDNQLVVAYALAALNELGTNVIDDPPDFLRQDNRRFMRRIGSFAKYTTVAKLLKDLQRAKH